VARKNIHDEDDEFDDPVDVMEEDDELAAAGYFVENEDGMEEGKKKLEFEDEEAYFLDHSDGGRVPGEALFDEYADHLDSDIDEDEEGGHDAPKNN
jgi:hypothetical protein